MSSTKHFFADPDALVLASLRSLTLTNPGLALDERHKIVYRRPRAHGGPPSAHQQVSLVSGGGAGHEPAFAGFVGPGLLSAAVAGSIFASPSAAQVRTALLGRVDNAAPQQQQQQHEGGGARKPGAGVLVVVMNYTGDVLNFGMAVEKARAAGVPAEMLVVGDDAGVGRAAAGKVGRRGIAGTLLVVKICGALAARGADLETVAKVGRLVAANLVSVGASLERVHVPGHDGDKEPGLARGEVEIGSQCLVPDSCPSRLPTTPLPPFPCRRAATDTLTSKWVSTTSRARRARRSRCRPSWAACWRCCWTGPTATGAS